MRIQANKQETNLLDGKLNNGPPAFDENNNVLVGDNDYYTHIRQNSIKLFNYHARYNTFRVDFLDLLDNLVQDGILVDKINTLKIRNNLKSMPVNNVIKYLADISFQKQTKNLIETKSNLYLNEFDVDYSMLEPIKYNLIDVSIIQKILEGLQYIIPRLDDVPMYDQGSYQSCTSNCSAFLYRYAELIENNSYQFDPSRFYIWFNTFYSGEADPKPNRYTKIYGDWGTSTTRAVLSTLKTWYGVCRNSAYSYPLSGGQIPGPVTKTMDNEAKKGYSYAVTACEHIVHSIKTALHIKKRPISMAFDVYNSGFYDGSANETGDLHLPVVVDEAGENPTIDYNFVYEAKDGDGKLQTYRDIAGSHAVCIVGYDDNHKFRKLNYVKGPNKGKSFYDNKYSGRWSGEYESDIDGKHVYESYKGGFLVRNSWGSWGYYSDGTIDGHNGGKNRGYFWMPYMYFNGEGSAVNTPTCGEFLFLDTNNTENNGKSVSNPPAWSYLSIIKLLYQYIIDIPKIIFIPRVAQPVKVITTEHIEKLNIDAYPGKF